MSFKEMEFDIWLDYALLFWLRLSKEKDYVIEHDEELKENYKKFMDLYKDEILEALKKTDK